MLDQILGENITLFRQTRPTKEKKELSFTSEELTETAPNEIMCLKCSKITLKPMYCYSCTQSICKNCIDQKFFFSTTIKCPSCEQLTVKSTCKTLWKRIGLLQTRCKHKDCESIINLSLYKSSR